MKLTATSLLFAGLSAAQHVQVPAYCTSGFGEGWSIVNHTVPYTYKEVMSIIGSFKNLTWSGNPPNTVTLNGTDNKVGTARTYILPALPGVPVIETITKYSKPENGPYEEIHTTALLVIPNPAGYAPLEAYIPEDATTVTELCDGKASQFIFTANFCATNVAAGQALLDDAHLADAQMVGTMLGGKRFFDCADLGVYSPKPGQVAPAIPPLSPAPSEARPPVKMLGAGLSVAAAVVVSAALLI